MINIDFEDDEDNDFFLNHLRKCFIATDTECFCEHVILPELEIQLKVKKELKGGNKEDEWRRRLRNYLKIQNHDYFSNIDSINRSNTNDHAFDIFSKEAFETDNKSQKQLNLIEKDKKGTPVSLSSSEFEKLFEKRESKPQIPQNNYTSVCSTLIASAKVERNIFDNYAKFESENNAKKFKIYFLLNNTLPSLIKPMDVSIIRTAKISDLIGLICFKYITENREPPLRFKDVSGYSLKITEDDGEIDFEFPSLELTKNVNVFGFEKLAFIENPNGKLHCLNENSNNKIDNNIEVLIYLSDGSAPVRLEFNSKYIPMSVVYDQICCLKPHSSKMNYIFEHVKSGAITDMTKELWEFEEFKFYFYREHSVKMTIDEIEQLLNINGNPVKPTVEWFEVEYLSKWRKIPVKIGIDGNKMDIEECTHDANNKTTYTISIDHIVDFILLKEHLNNNKSQFRIILVDLKDPQQQQLLSNTYSYIDFEAHTKDMEQLKQILLELIKLKFTKYYFQYCSCDNTIEKNLVKWSRKKFLIKRKDSLL